MKAPDHILEDQLISKLYSCPPFLSEHDAKLIDEQMKSDAFCLGRPIGLAAASKAGDWFRALSNDDDHKTAVSMMCATLALREHIARMKELTECLQAGELRLSLALAARLDFQAVEAEATAATAAC